ncbi:uncharacterized protein L969DRAFT_84482 [Mixia osmundae IAM 14324]|uniref:DNA-binding protein REB1 n=1 Tax=Mixia osmundae (strain CBS 9802 / IAM 14324 / JCM 22182 / KY 12970) TaxID=764103 RepID=G7DZB5_MIXOS|nr:uncharacterized protein L969DRAFT_84482 [Mixia osmundae IAM 14324]KEI42609.1 hypothetical protein L969DRAFT_84482 [Mixia osmundae IAM 14324]GAA95925.1 hypothetical protein E5Q_02583 [Mixia osmundae IAM 14324]
MSSEKPRKEKRRRRDDNGSPGPTDSAGQETQHKKTKKHKKKRDAVATTTSMPELMTHQPFVDSSERPTASSSKITHEPTMTMTGEPTLGLDEPRKKKKRKSNKHAYAPVAEASSGSHDDHHHHGLSGAMGDINSATLHPAATTSTSDGSEQGPMLANPEDFATLFATFTQGVPHPPSPTTAAASHLGHDRMDPSMLDPSLSDMRQDRINQIYQHYDNGDEEILRGALQAIGAEFGSSATQDQQDHTRLGLTYTDAHVGDALPAGDLGPQLSEVSTKPKKTRKAANSQTKAAKKAAKPSTTESVADLTNQEILTKRWFSSARLKELSETRGLTYKKGKFNSDEEAAIEAFLEDYKKRNDLDEDGMLRVIYAKGKKARAEHQDFWPNLTATLKERPVIAVYHYLQRLKHPQGRQGAWTPSQDKALKDAHLMFGGEWNKVSANVGRMPADCRDRWRNHLMNSEIRKVGVWTDEEVDKLRSAVASADSALNGNRENDAYWNLVAKQMADTRTRAQCRIKWADVSFADKKPKEQVKKRLRWTARDDYILIHKIAALEPTDQAEINYSLLLDPGWHQWSAAQVARRFGRIKKKVKAEMVTRPKYFGQDPESLTFRSILDYLKSVRYAAAPARDVVDTEDEE